MRQKTQISVLLVSALTAAGMPAGAQERAREEIVVFAAASLHDAFQKIGREFSAAHPGLTCTYNFAGSQQLAEQILQGAPADVFASADMKQIAAAGPRIDTASVRIFTRNRLAIAVPGAGAGMIRAISDLGNPGIKLVLAHREVPAGKYALEFLSGCEASGKFPGGFREAVLRNVVSYEENVRSVLSKIVLDEADAGIVYVSDIGGAAGQSVRTIEIPDSLNVLAAYPAGRILDSKHGEASDGFIAFLLSDTGERILVQYGFTGVTRPDARREARFQK